MSSGAYELIAGDLHRHGALSHAHCHDGPHEHDGHDHVHGHGHSHGLVDESIKRSRGSYNRMLWTALRGEAAYLPGC
jgi:hypothetical protein